MNAFEYGDEEISKREIWMTLSSFLIGTGILTLPSTLAERTEAADGWVSLLIGGIVSLIFAWMAAKLAARFPKTTFLDYTSVIVGRAPAVGLTLLYSVMFLGVAASSTREIANIAKLYLFDRTPLEVIALVFLLPVIYAVAGSSTALLRLNLMFLPIVLLIVCLVLVFNIHFISGEDLLPLFTTTPSGYWQGLVDSTFSYLGYGCLLFYITLMNQPKSAPGAAILGMTIPIVLYIFIYVMTIGILTNETTANIIYPTVEIAKEVEVPGQFFERFESIFFTIWIMTIFNTVAMSLDISVISLRYVFPRARKVTWLLILASIAYLMAMKPKNELDLHQFQEWLSYTGVLLSMLIPALLLLIAAIRKVNGSG